MRSRWPPSTRRPPSSLPMDSSCWKTTRAWKSWPAYLISIPTFLSIVAFAHNARQPANYTVSKAREFYIKYRDRILFGSDVFAAGGEAAGFLNERKLLETNEVTNGLHGGPQFEGFNLPDPRAEPHLLLERRPPDSTGSPGAGSADFKIGYELGNFKFDRLPPDVTVNHSLSKRSGCRSNGQPGIGHEKAGGRNRREDVPGRGPHERHLEVVPFQVRQHSAGEIRREGDG